MKTSRKDTSYEKLIHRMSLDYLQYQNTVQIYFLEVILDGMDIQ